MLFLQRQFGDASRTLPEGAGDRSRGPAGALQPDALLAGAGRRGCRRARAGSSTCGSRPTKSAQAITGPYRQLTPTTTTSASRSTSTGRSGCPSPAAPCRRCGRRRAAGRAVRDDGRAGRWRAPSRPAAPRRRSVTVHRRHRAPPASASATTTAPSARSTCRRRWARASRSSTPTATAGRTSCSSTRRTGPGSPAPTSLPGALPQQPRRHVHRRHAAGRPGGRDVRHGRRPPPTTTTTATSTSTSPASGGNHLFRNTGGGKFVDVTAKAGVGQRRVLDQRRLVRLRPRRPARSLRRALRRLVDRERPRSARSTARRSRTARPSRTRARARRSITTVGDGTFEDVTKKAGLYDRDVEGARRRASSTTTATAGSTCSSPTTRSRTGCIATSRTARSPTSAMTAGVAFNEAGVARAGMGVDAADYDGSGRQSLVIGNFSNEMMALYHNEGNGLFIDEAPTSAIGQASLLTLTFALLLLRLDLDGRLDIFAANGHVADDISRVQPTVTYAQPPHLFRNLGSKQFEEVDRAARAGAAGAGRRRAAPPTPTIDNDGDLDLLSPTNNGPARLLRNDGGSRNHVLRVAHGRHRVEPRRHRRAGRASRRPAAPAPWQMVKTGSSYCSQSELPLTFGLGAATAVTSIEVTWPTAASTGRPASPPTRPSRSRKARASSRTAPIRAVRHDAARRRDRSPCSPRSALVAACGSAAAGSAGAASRGPRERPTAPTTSASPCSSSSTSTPRPRRSGDALAIDAALGARARQPRASRCSTPASSTRRARGARSRGAALPDAPQPHYVLGLIAKAQNRPDDAIAAFERVLRDRSVRCRRPASTSGSLPAAARRYAEAIDALRRRRSPPSRTT